ncbi:MAG: LytTR family DNA-binding domain-containing protein [Rhodanobacteraceae bacterium]
MRTLIVDDEAPARERLRSLLIETGGIDIVGEADNGLAALEMAARDAPDLVLLDIRMPGMDGLEAARHLGAFEAPPAIIFCTAFDEHALAAFDADAVDYLVKPVRVERLQTALAKVRRSGSAGSQPAARVGAARQRSHLCARSRGDLVLVPIVEIDYLVADDRYVLVHHRKGELLIEESLKALEQEFDSYLVRIHRNCLVARDRLTGLVRSGDGRVLVRVAGYEEPLEASRRNLPGLRRLLRDL